VEGDGAEGPAAEGGGLEADGGEESDPDFMKGSPPSHRAIGKSIFTE